MRKLFVNIILLFALSQYVAAQSLFSVDLQKNTSLTIHASSNLMSFNFIQNGEKLTRRNIVLESTRNQNKLFLSQNQLSVVLKDFSSPNKIALKDFMKLLKSDAYPTLQVKVNCLDILPKSDKSQSYTGNALVDITITGVTKQYSIPITTNAAGEMQLVDGKKKINIRDFNLNPPVQMMGLIKVSEWIDVDFHMICRIKSENLAN